GGGEGRGGGGGGGQGGGGGRGGRGAGGRGPAGRLDGGGLPPWRRDGPGRGDRAGSVRAAGALLQRAARLSGVRRVVSRDRAAVLLLQQSARRMPHLRWSRCATPARPHAGGARAAQGPSGGAFTRRAARPARSGREPRGSGRSLPVLA